MEKTATRSAAKAPETAKTFVSAKKSGIKVSPVNMKARVALGLRAGDTVRVWQNIVELKKGRGANKKEVTTRNVRRQAFEGLILAVKHGTEAGATFTVRRVASGVGVEKIFPLYSPNIDTVEILKRARVRRAKLYFIRRKAARDVRRQMRKSRAFTPSETAEDEIVENEAEITEPIVAEEVVDVLEAEAAEATAAAE